MYHILFVDFNSNKPYCLETLSKIGLGGTEATIIRVAEALSNKAKITVAQEARKTGAAKKTSVTYIAWGELLGDELYQTKNTFDIVILLRRPELMRLIAQRFPSARKILWLHDIPSKRFGRYLLQLKRFSFELITVSDFQKQLLTDVLRQSTDLLAKTYYFFTKFYLPRITTIYNPLASYVKKQPLAINPHKLIFFSSPSKGLVDVLSTFKQLRKFDNRFTLFIANPGYTFSEIDASLTEGVINLGILTHKEVIKEVSNAFCTFQPQHSVPETFGLVYAESDAVGTPVITYDFGAAREILSSPEQLVAAFDQKKVIDKVLMWSNNGRPIVSAREDFKIQRITDKWADYLNL